MPLPDAQRSRPAGPIRDWLARRLVAWMLDEPCGYPDPLSIDPTAFDRIEHVLRVREHEPSCPDPQLLAREILDAPDRSARLMAVGRLLAIHVNELKIARAAATA